MVSFQNYCSGLVAVVPVIGLAVSKLLVDLGGIGCIVASHIASL